MKTATLYFHSSCFDGLVSAVLAWAFIENRGQLRIGQLLPVDYSVRDTWISMRLNGPSAIVDFLYHPRAFFWADHHLSSFITPNAKQNFLSRERTACLWYDELAPSCAAVIWQRSNRCFRGSDRVRLEEMIHWANKVDSAAYGSPHEAIFKGCVFSPSGSHYSVLDITLDSPTGHVTRTGFVSG